MIYKFNLLTVGDKVIWINGKDKDYDLYIYTRHIYSISIKKINKQNKNYNYDMGNLWQLRYET